MGGNTFLLQNSNIPWLSLHQGGVVMSSQITHTWSSTYTPEHIYLTSAPWFSIVAPFLQCIPTAVTASHPSPGDNHQSTEGGPKEHSAMQKWTGKTYSVTYVPLLSNLSDHSRTDAQPPPSFLFCPRPPSHHPSSLTSVSLVPALHLLPASTPFCPYGTPQSEIYRRGNVHYSWIIVDYSWLGLELPTKWKNWEFAIIDYPRIFL